MRFWPFRCKPKVDTLGFAHDLLLDQDTLPRLDNSERGKAFARVFLSTTEGRQVLAKIVEWSGLLQPGVSVDDPYRLHVTEGARMLAMKIIAELAYESRQRKRGEQGETNNEPAEQEVD